MRPIRDEIRLRVEALLAASCWNAGRTFAFSKPALPCPSWGHNRLLSPWCLNIDAASRRLLETPCPGYPADSIATGAAAGSDPCAQRALADGRNLTVDVVVPAPGFGPDFSALAELHLDLDPVVAAPRRRGPLIDPELRSCGTVPAHGERLLAHPEHNFHTVGMKSCGRTPTFLLATGCEHVRSTAAALSGDREGADLLKWNCPQRVAALQASSHLCPDG